MRIAIEAVGVLAPGLPDWDGTRAVLAGGPYVGAPLEPCAPASLSPVERRRSSPTVRLAIAAAEQALQCTAIPPHDMALVFASPQEAAADITHQLFAKRSRGSRAGSSPDCAVSTTRCTTRPPATTASR